MKYDSITTPGVKHDEANMLVELIYLNKDIQTDMFPWRGDNGKQWGKLVSAVKKLMGPSFGLSPEQIAFYIFKCSPQQINPFEFAKMAVVARKLFRRFDLDEVRTHYINRRNETKPSGLEAATFKQHKHKSLLTFLRELERGEI